MQPPPQQQQRPSLDELLMAAEEKGLTFVNASAPSAGPPGIADEATVISMAFEVSVIAIGFLLNLLLVVAIVRSPRLQAPIFQLLLGLAASDVLFFLTFAAPRVYDYFAAAPREWIYGRAGCAAFKFFEYMTPQVTGCLILVSCWERFYAVCRPASAHWVTTKKMAAIIVLIWIVNTGVCAPLLIKTTTAVVKFADGFEMSTCRVTMAEGVTRLYDTVTAMLFYALASFTSLLFLACTICKAMKVDHEFIKDDFKNHVLRCIVIVTILNVILWLPHRVVALHNVHARSHADRITGEAIVAAARQLACLAAATRPVIYLTASSQFRSAIIRVFRCCKANEVMYEPTRLQMVPAGGERSPL